MQNVRGNLLVVLACLLVAIVIEARLPTRSGGNAVAADETLDSLPYQLGPFTGRDAHSRDVEGYPGEIHRDYSQAQGSSIEVLAFSTPVNTHGPEDCLPYLGWSIIDRDHRKLQANPAIALETVIAVPDNPSARPLACGFYWRRNKRGTANLLIGWLQQRWATITQSLQEAQFVSICTTLDDLRQARPAAEQVYQFANLLEPYFQRSSAPAVRSEIR
jgi:Protein of unknown function (DUF3485)